MKINEENLKNLSKQSLFQYQKLFPVLTKEKNREYGMLGLTFITLTIFGIFAINPTLTTIAELQKKVEDARFVDQQLTQKLTNLRTLRTQYDSLQSDLVFVEQALPKKPLPVRFIGQIQALASETNVQLTSFRIATLSLNDGTLQPEDLTKTTAAAPYSYSLQVSGTYRQVREFLTVLTGFERITTVNSITVSRDTTGRSAILMEIGGTTFYKP